MIDIEKLEALARAATAGVWNCSSEAVYSYEGKLYDDGTVMADTRVARAIADDAAHIAAASPATMLRLCAVVRAAEDALGKFGDEYEGRFAALREALAALEAP